MTGSPVPPGRPVPHGAAPVVLVVDDDDDVREVTAFALQALGGFDVREAPGGAEALCAMATRVPDLVLLDVMMPGMDGPAVLRAMRQDPRTASVPVVLLTAKVRVSREPVAAEIAGIVSKPFDPQGLVAEVSRVLAETVRSAQSAHSTQTAGTDGTDGTDDLSPHSSASR